VHGDPGEGSVLNSDFEFPKGDRLSLACFYARVPVSLEMLKIFLFAWRIYQLIVSSYRYFSLFRKPSMKMTTLVSMQVVDLTRVTGT